MKNRIASLLPVVSLLVVIRALPAAPLHRESSQKPAVMLLERIRETAQDVAATAERLEAYNRFPNEYSRVAHLVELEALKDAINGMGRDLDRLAASRSALDEADRRAVNRVMTATAQLAQTANAVILKAGQVDATPALSVDYRKLMEECSHQAGELIKALEAGIVELR